MSTIDEQFIEFIVKSLVSNPDDVHIDRSIDEKGVLLELTVNPEDLGRVIGKRGATAQSMRTLLRALGTKNDARYNLKIIDNGPEQKHRKPSPKKERDEQVQDKAKVSPKEDENLVDVSDEKTTAKEEPKEESLAERTRKELEDLDDLDV